MSLFKTDDTGRMWEVKEWSLPKDYKKAVARLSLNHQREICDFILDKISDGQVFSVATKFGHSHMNWKGTPLMKLYSVAKKDVTITAILLGYFVQKTLIELDDTKWFCTKTDITKRDLETNFYFTQALKKVA